MTTSSLYNRIKELWNAAGADIMSPAHLLPESEEARRLDDELTELIREQLPLWEEGVISSVELVDRIIEAAFAPREF